MSEIRLSRDSIVSVIDVYYYWSVISVLMGSSLLLSVTSFATFGRIVTFSPVFVCSTALATGVTFRISFGHYISPSFIALQQVITLSMSSLYSFHLSVRVSETLIDMWSLISPAGIIHICSGFRSSRLSNASNKK